MADFQLITQEGVHFWLGKKGIHLSVFTPKTTEMNTSLSFQPFL